MKSSFCNGTVIHNRLSPKLHKFKYQMSWCLFDLDEIDEIFSQSKAWSLNKFNIISLKNQAYINASADAIKSKVQIYLQENVGKKFNGKIFLFTHPRYLGFEFNSVNFYFCYVEDELVYIISEINNTPWKQKHLYLHTINKLNNGANKESLEHVFELRKEFHISPFVDMAIDYIWKFTINAEQFNVNMQLIKQSEPLMHVILNTKIIPMQDQSLFKWTISKPFQPLKMFAGIYWQALKIFIKRIPFFSHP